MEVVRLPSVGASFKNGGVVHPFSQVLQKSQKKFFKKLINF
jgi:hypothetical protein